MSFDRAPDGPGEEPGRIAVIAPNLKHTFSGVTATIIALVPVQRRDLAVVTTGWGIPPEVAHVALGSLWRILRTPPRDVPFRIWHARRNVEMIAGLALRILTGRRLGLVFTSAAQRHHKWLTRQLIARMDAVIAPTERAASYLRVPSTVIPHGVDTELFHPASPGERDADDGRIWAGCFGRVRPNKGTDLFVDTMIAAMADHANLNAVILGLVAPEHRGFADELRRRIADAGLGERFHFPGELPRAEQIAWYRRLSLFVAPQRWEGFGLTVPEAMASGVAVVAADVGAFSQFVSDDSVGRLVPADDGAAIEAAVRELLADPDRLERMGLAARARIEAGGGIEHEARAVNAVYRRLWQAG